jgi:intracellular septation protein
MDFFHFALSFFIEFGPLVGFLFFAQTFDFFVGVYALMIFTFFSLLFSFLRDKRLPIFSIYTGIAVLFFGFLSIYFRNPYLVVLEYTLYNFIFSLLAYIGYKKQKPIMKTLFPTMFEMNDKGWHVMSVAWGIFFVITGILNEYFWHFHNEHVWLIFRSITLVVATLFGMILFFVARKERLPNATKWGLKKY